MNNALFPAFFVSGYCTAQGGVFPMAVHYEVRGHLRRRIAFHARLALALGNDVCRHRRAA